MIHRFPNLWAHMFDRSDREGSEWASALAENGQPNAVEAWDAWAGRNVGDWTEAQVDELLENSER